MTKDPSLVRWFPDLGRADTAIVGGKNASLGKMILDADFPAPLAEAITRGYHEMAERSGGCQETSTQNDGAGEERS